MKMKAIGIEAASKIIGNESIGINVASAESVKISKWRRQWRSNNRKKSAYNNGNGVA